MSLSPDAWQANADKHEGSWWPRWSLWLGARSGGQVTARAAGNTTHPVLGAAPGTYVTATPES
jgi:polyhydroxyalkanoate synthase subunit PhaC